MNGIAGNGWDDPQEGYMWRVHAISGGRVDLFIPFLDAASARIEAGDGGTVERAQVGPWEAVE